MGRWPRTMLSRSLREACRRKCSLRKPSPSASLGSPKYEKAKGEDDGDSAGFDDTSMKAAEKKPDVEGRGPAEPMPAAPGAVTEEHPVNQGVWSEFARRKGYDDSETARVWVCEPPPGYSRWVVPCQPSGIACEDPGRDRSREGEGNGLVKSLRKGP
jgi:hypothetical protein